MKRKTSRFLSKERLAFLFFCCSFVLYAQSTTSEFKTLYKGNSFTSITVDQNKNVWAGTDRQGLYFLDQTQEEPAFKLLSIGTSPLVSSLRIQSLAADGSGNVWVGHGGTSFGNLQGGAERININTFEVQHLSPDADAKGLNYIARDGLGTLNSQQVVVSRDNTVWMAHNYHDITSTGEGGTSYIVTPGTFSFRKADNYSGRFDAVGTWKDHQEGKAESVFPYPNYTFNPGFNDPTSTRSCHAISVYTQAQMLSYVWVSVASYTSLSGKVFPARLMKYIIYNSGLMNNTENYTIKDVKFSKGSTVNTFNGVFINKKGNTVWATTGITGNGFSVLKDKVWYNITDSKIIPPNTRFNDKAIWEDASGRVYLGTDKGLIVYDGKGSVTDAFSYTLFTKEKYDSPRNRFDPDMLSNNITAGVSEGIEGPFVWLATPEGIMKAFIVLEEEMRVYNIKNRKYPYQESFLTSENYITIATLVRESKNYIPDEESIPYLAVDGTTSTVFRLKIGAGVDALFYDDDKKEFKVKIKNKKGEILVENNGITKDNLRYGELMLKPKPYYTISDYDEEGYLKYVDIIYKHPTYIAKEDFVEGEHYSSKYELQAVWGDEEEESSWVAFKHPIRFSLPPVLLVHGVWSDISSLESIEKYLKTEGGYSANEIQRAWRTDGEAAENPFEYDAGEVPKNIDELKQKARAIKISAGKVNVVTHSRGGLYTRAYIQDFSVEKSGVRKYDDDINLLITCNTPHGGSPLANAVMDKRIIIPEINWLKTVPFGIILSETVLSDLPFAKTAPISIGDMFSLFAPEKDRKDNWGAKNLMVPNDLWSESYTEETTFIEVLNYKNNRDKLAENKVPIHAIATNFDPCEAAKIFCSGIWKQYNDLMPLSKRLTWFDLIVQVALYTIDNGPKHLKDFLKYVHGDENNDLIVPESSMKAGLEEKYISTFPGENIMHIDPGKGKLVSKFNVSGVMVNKNVHKKIWELFQENPQKSESFTTKGITPPYLSYKFLPGFKGLSSKKLAKTEDVSNKIIVIDSASIKKIISGSEFSFDVYQENLDHMAIICEYEGTEMANYNKKNENIEYSNTFTFNVPEGFLGKVKITAFGFSGERLVTGHSVEAKVELPDDVLLKGIRFDENQGFVLEGATYRYNILGTFSDGVERRINDSFEIKVMIDNENIVEQVDNETLKSMMPGTAVVMAYAGNYSTQLSLTVDENAALKKTLITDFYAEEDDTSNVNLAWKTYHEYESKQFVLERSENDDQHFVQIDQQVGKGTFNQPSDYAFLDSPKADIIYYRLKLYNTNDDEVYSEVIKVELGAMSIEEPEVKKADKDKIVLAPNPLRDSSGILLLNSTITDTSAVLNIYDINGRLISSKKVIIGTGEQRVNFEIPTSLTNGIYLIQLKTNKYTHTQKLILQR